MFKLSSDHLANFRSIGALLETFKGWINDLRLQIGNTEDRLDVLEATPSGTSLPIDATDVNYDNTTSGLAATNVQDAIDKLAAGSGATNIPHQFDDARTYRSPLRLSADGLVLTNASASDFYSTAVSYPCRHEDSKVYFEVNVTGSARTRDFVGIVTNSAVESAEGSVRSNADYYYHLVFKSGSFTSRSTSDAGSAAWGTAWGADPVIGIAVDRTSGKIYYAINGTWQEGEEPDSDNSTIQLTVWEHRFRAYCSCYTSGMSMEIVAREADMTYSVPTGYVALAG